METEALREELKETDVSLGFLFLIILGILLFFLASVRGRDALCARLAGETPEEDLLSPRLSRAGGAVVLGASGFFLMLAARTLRGASRATRPSALRNLWASALVLAAALIRQWDRDAAPGELAEDAEPI